MNNTEDFALLGLSVKEKSVLAALNTGINTPLAISRSTRVSRPAVYAILANLKKRGLATTNIRSGKHYWRISDRKELERNFFETKRSLLGLPDGTQEVYGMDDSTVIVHRGNDAVRAAMNEMLKDHKNERFYGFVGDKSAEGWNSVFSKSETNAINREIKKRNIISEGILSERFFEGQVREMGLEWAKDFEGRTARTNVIGDEYFQNGAQMFIFRESIYLMALAEELIIEIRHSDIQRMILSLFRFIQDNSRTIDVNALLRKIIANEAQVKV
jgi:sugar-specific transcriptional regulator TrmB